MMVGANGGACLEVGIVRSNARADSSIQAVIIWSDPARQSSSDYCKEYQTYSPQKIQSPNPSLLVLDARLCRIR
jgi:hypothetical protein